MADSADWGKTPLHRGLVKAVGQGVVAGLLLGVAFAAGFFYRDLVIGTNPLLGSSQSRASFLLVSETDALLEQYFLYPLPDDTTRIHGAVAGLVASYNDPYTYFVEPRAAEVDTGNLAGRFGGIGAEITQDELGRFVIVRVYRDNPAYEAGIREGDIIVAVDGTTLNPDQYDMNAALALIRGAIGDPVALTIARGDETLEFEVVRAEVLVPSTLWRILEENPRIGYIQITRFTERAPEELRQAIAELTDQGAEALILDLRNNGGGLVDSAVGVSSEFLDGGVILYEERQGQDERVFNASRDGTAHDIPLAVLVNQGTASAAEIVAGALQDRGRAQLIGQQTYGKGSVQLILPLSDGSSIHVTTAQWFTPNRHRLEGQGLFPDTTVQAAEDTDVELAAGIDAIEGLLPASTSNNTQPD
jgi:carboxyl-terminal processing protease